MERLIVGMALAQEVLFFLRCPFDPVAQEANRVTVPRCDIEVGTDRPVVECRDPAHIIVDEWSISVLAQLIRLHLVEGHDLIRAVSPERQNMCRVRLSNGQVRQIHLIETVIIHRPKHIAPSAVHRIRGLIALREPIAKT